MTNRMLLSIAAISALVAYCFHRGRDVRATHARVKDDLHRWEGEGGNVPQVATPSPAPGPQPYAAGDSTLRH